MIMSIFLEKPHTAPTIMPMLRFITAHISARDMDILDPTQTVSKVGSPEPPEPSIQLRLKPNFSIAAPGIRCFVVESVIFA